MNLGIMQPYFMPYIGYFQLMKAVDKYVIYDDVNYIKGGWINRNNLIVAGKKSLFTIMLSQASPNKLINEIEIKDDFRRLLRTLQMNYCKAPYYGPVMELMENIVSFPDRQLALFIGNSFKCVLSYLGIKTELIYSSQLSKDCGLRGQDKVIDICNLLKADTYLNAIGGMELYDREEFKKHGIDLRFLKTGGIEYSQFNSDFIPYL